MKSYRVVKRMNSSDRLNAGEKHANRGTNRADHSGNGQSHRVNDPGSGNSNQLASGNKYDSPPASGNKYDSPSGSENKYGSLPGSRSSQPGSGNRQESQPDSKPRLQSIIEVRSKDTSPDRLPPERALGPPTSKSGNMNAKISGNMNAGTENMNAESSASDRQHCKTAYQAAYQALSSSKVGSASNKWRGDILIEDITGREDSGVAHGAIIDSGPNANANHGFVTMGLQQLGAWGGVSNGANSLSGANSLTGANKQQLNARDLFGFNPPAGISHLLTTIPLQAGKKAPSTIPPNSARTNNGPGSTIPPSVEPDDNLPVPFGGVINDSRNQPSPSGRSAPLVIRNGRSAPGTAPLSGRSRPSVPLSEQKTMANSSPSAKSSTKGTLAVVRPRGLSSSRSLSSFRFRPSNASTNSKHRIMDGTPWPRPNVTDLARCSPAWGDPHEGMSRCSPRAPGLFTTMNRCVLDNCAHCQMWLEHTMWADEKARQDVQEWMKNHLEDQDENGDPKCVHCIARREHCAQLDSLERLYQEEMKQQSSMHTERLDLFKEPGASRSRNEVVSPRSDIKEILASSQQQSQRMMVSQQHPSQQSPHLSTIPVQAVLSKAALNDRGTVFPRDGNTARSGRMRSAAACGTSLSKDRMSQSGRPADRAARTYQVTISFQDRNSFAGGNSSQGNSYRLDNSHVVNHAGSKDRTPQTFSDQGVIPPTHADSYLDKTAKFGRSNASRNASARQQSESVRQQSVREQSVRHPSVHQHSASQQLLTTPENANADDQFSFGKQSPGNLAHAEAFLASLQFPGQNGSLNGNGSFNGSSVQSSRKGSFTLASANALQAIKRSQNMQNAYLGGIDSSSRHKFDQNDTVAPQNDRVAPRSGSRQREKTPRSPGQSGVPLQQSSAAYRSLVTPAHQSSARPSQQESYRSQQGSRELQLERYMSPSGSHRNAYRGDRIDGSHRGEFGKMSKSKDKIVSYVTESSSPGQRDRGSFEFTANIGNYAVGGKADFCLRTISQDKSGYPPLLRERIDTDRTDRGHDNARSSNRYDADRSTNRYYPDRSNNRYEGDRGSGRVGKGLADLYLSLPVDSKQRSSKQRSGAMDGGSKEWNDGYYILKDTDAIQTPNGTPKIIGVQTSAEENREIFSRRDGQGFPGRSKSQSREPSHERSEQLRSDQRDVEQLLQQRSERILRESLAHGNLGHGASKPRSYAGSQQRSYAGSQQPNYQSTLLDGAARRAEQVLRSYRSSRAGDERVLSLRAGTHQGASAQPRISQAENIAPPSELSKFSADSINQQGIRYDGNSHLSLKENFPQKEMPFQMVPADEDDMKTISDTISEEAHQGASQKDGPRGERLQSGPRGEQVHGQAERLQGEPLNVADKRDEIRKAVWERYYESVGLGRNISLSASKSGRVGNKNATEERLLGRSKQQGIGMPTETSPTKPIGEATDNGPGNMQCETTSALQSGLRMAAGNGLQMDGIVGITKNGVGRIELFDLIDGNVAVKISKDNLVLTE